MHERGLKLVMDLVVNHTSDEHPWFVESRSSRDNPRRDWYWWRPPRFGMASRCARGRADQLGLVLLRARPGSWTSATGEYYLHLFSRKQPDLNWENPEVRQAVYAMMRWWLDRGVDGFRMDVINMISKDTALPDGPVLGPDPYGDGAAYFIDGPRIHEFLQRDAPEAVLTDGDLLSVGEMPGVTVDEARLFTDPARAEVDMVFQFEHVGLDHGASKWDMQPLDLRDLKTSFGRWQAGLADVGWNSLYWDNHDQPRIVSRWGDGSPLLGQDARHAAAPAPRHAVRLPGRGARHDELPVVGGIAEFRDIESVNHYADAVARGADPELVLAGLREASRDNARTPMQWDASANAGFSTGTPWLPVNPNHTEINAAAQRDDPDSVLAHYKRLIALRHEEPAVALGDFTMLLPDDRQVYAFTRRLESTELLVLCNVSGSPAAVELPEPAPWASAELLLGTHGTPGTGTLRPWESRVLRRVVA